MKIGDLVELSAYGKSVDYLSWLSKDSVGLVTGMRGHGWTWTVLWYGQGSKLIQRRLRMDRKCLKHAKVKK